MLALKKVRKSLKSRKLSMDPKNLLNQDGFSIGT